MLRIEIFIDYYEDGTHSIKKINVNDMAVAEFDYAKGKIDLEVLRPYLGCGAKLINNHIGNKQKNNSKYVIITNIKEIEGIKAVCFDDK